MPFDKYSPKQKKLARVAEPRDKITGADFEAMKKAGGGMVRYAEGGDVRREMLMQLREDAMDRGDDDAIIEIDAELFQMGDSDGDTKKFRYGGKVKGMRSGGCVKCMGPCQCGTKARGGGAAVSGTKYSGTF